ncbi:MAG: hypothetical protein M4D80_23135 [Myxococcota bacterium]|nr:hypothetical protein [Deltaproteobacteria bacterium]MDQ3338070.1 hypothetical protein [Myxococcota bacterium]
MASKKTTSKKKKLPPKKAPAKKAAAPKKEKKEPVKVGPRHPHGRVKATSQGSKEALAKALAPTLARSDEDTDMLEARLKTASNNQLLRLQKVADAVKSKYGSRAGLIEAIGKGAAKSKDKDYISKLETLSLPNLLDLAKSADRRARA